MTVTITAAAIIWIVVLNLFTLAVGGLIGALIVAKLFEKSMVEAERLATKAKKALKELKKEVHETWEHS